MFPNFDQTRSTMQTANIVHMVSAYLAIALACVHIYLGTIGMTGAYRAMRDGYVDESWAEHHHARWYQDILAGRARETFVQPDAAGRGRRSGLAVDARANRLTIAGRMEPSRSTPPRHHSADRGGVSARPGYPQALS